MSSRGSFFYLENDMLTQKRLKEVLHYDPEAGVFTWLVARGNKIKAGDIAGSVGPVGYRKIGIDGKIYKASRLACLYMEGCFPEYEVDHRDRVKNNNKWYNLRHATRSYNMKNCKIVSDNTSGVTGVNFHKKHNKWQAYITDGGKTMHLGSFNNFINAVHARWEAEVKYGWPNCNTTSPAFSCLQKKSPGY